MPKVWNLGNTTIRNPNRIELGLKVFADEFQGRVSGDVAESAFSHRLVDLGVVDSGGTYDDLLGRKWRSVFVKLGFVTDKNARVKAFIQANSHKFSREIEYQLTPMGEHLLKAQTLPAIQDVFLRQLLCHQLPNPMEKSYPEGAMKPLLLILEVLSLLKSQEQAGLSKTEIAMFLQVFQNHDEDLARNLVEKISEYRLKRAALQGNRIKKALDKQYYEIASQAGGVKQGTLEDYADTTVRYIYMTGLFAFEHKRLVLREEKTPVINAILAEPPQYESEMQEYLIRFYTGYPLPTDNLAFVQGELKRLQEELKNKRIGVPDGLDFRSDDILVLNNARYKLLEVLTQADEEVYAVTQREPNNIDETIAYLEALKTRRASSRIGINDRPSYLEWAVWRAFLAIDHVVGPIHQTRRFAIDQDFHPRHTAPGGGADMIFEFEDYILAVEVTLTTSSRQLSAEGEPVRRHVANIAESLGTTKRVYCVFIAPDVDNNTAETFRIGVWYRGDVEDYLDIVPLTIDQFVQVLTLLKHIEYTPQHFRSLLDVCLSHRNSRAPQWKLAISSATQDWVNSLYS